MPDEDEQPVWKSCVDRALLRATCSGQPFSAESILDCVGLVNCEQTLTYVRRRLAALGGANQPTVTDADTLKPWDEIAPEERIDAVIAVMLSDLDSLDGEEKEQALNTKRRWTFLREALQRHELRGLLLDETRRFVRERGGDK
ncbi:MAG TPA: hypothetical protein VGG18_11250 [Granulicella sp.]|jgi:hypothetical protein